MKQLHFNKRVVTAGKKAKICRNAVGSERLDPVGYFLIRVHGRKIEVGLCGYKKINIITRMWTGSKPQDVYTQVIKDVKISKEHAAYLGKELARAWMCMQTGVDYVQDGKMDGTFPEADWLRKR